MHQLQCPYDADESSFLSPEAKTLLSSSFCLDQGAKGIEPTNGSFPQSSWNPGTIGPFLCAPEAFLSPTEYNSLSDTAKPVLSYSPLPADIRSRHNPEDVESASGALDPLLPSLPDRPAPLPNKRPNLPIQENPFQKENHDDFLTLLSTSPPTLLTKAPSPYYHPEYPASNLSPLLGRHCPVPIGPNPDGLQQMNTLKRTWVLIRLF